MSNTSFFGGRPGQSFSISHVFPNREAMISDLNCGFESTIGFNEYVMINYGQKDIEIAANNQIDEDANYSYSNNTLWEKCYFDDGEESESLIKADGYNICYKLIARFTITIPSIKAELEMLNPDNASPSVEVEIEENQESVNFKFGMPRAARFFEGNENCSNGQIKDNEAYATGDFYLSKTTGQLVRIGEQLENIPGYRKATLEVSFTHTIRETIDMFIGDKNYPSDGSDNFVDQRENIIENLIEWQEKNKDNLLGSAEKIQVNYEVQAAEEGASTSMIAFDCYLLDKTNYANQNAWSVQRVTSNAYDWAEQMTWGDPKYEDEAKYKNDFERIEHAYDSGKILSLKEAEVDNFKGNQFSFIGLTSEEDKSDSSIAYVTFKQYNYIKNAIPACNGSFDASTLKQFVDTDLISEETINGNNYKEFYIIPNISIKNLILDYSISVNSEYQNNTYVLYYQLFEKEFTPGMVLLEGEIAYDPFLPTPSIYLNDIELKQGVKYVIRFINDNDININLNIPGSGSMNAEELVINYQKDTITPILHPDTILGKNNEGSENFREKLDVYSKEETNNEIIEQLNITLQDRYADEWEELASSEKINPIVLENLLEPANLGSYAQCVCHPKMKIIQLNLLDGIGLEQFEEIKIEIAPNWFTPFKVPFIIANNSEEEYSWDNIKEEEYHQYDWEKFYGDANMKNSYISDGRKNTILQERLRSEPIPPNYLRTSYGRNTFATQIDIYTQGDLSKITELKKVNYKDYEFSKYDIFSEDGIFKLKKDNMMVYTKYNYGRLSTKGTLKLDPKLKGLIEPVTDFYELKPLYDGAYSNSITQQLDMKNDTKLFSCYIETNEKPSWGEIAQEDLDKGTLFGQEYIISNQYNISLMSSDQTINKFIQSDGEKMYITNNSILTQNLNKGSVNTLYAIIYPSGGLPAIYETYTHGWIASSSFGLAYDKDTHRLAQHNQYFDYVIKIYGRKKRPQQKEENN